jgi:glutamate synthase domain-containing protein 3
VALSFEGSAGQSFGAFNHRGVSLTLVGEAQDYVGKGMCGGEIVLRPAPELDDPDPVLLGNTVLYGATGGSLYAAGRLGERLAVRNSGATAVVHGCGDHGCEYMTGGTVVVLGPAGRNFGAGMSGGTAYVYDPSGAFPRRLNPAMVATARLPAGAPEPELRRLLERHRELTGSLRSAHILESWGEEVAAFFKVTPKGEVAGDADGSEAAERGTGSSSPSAVAAAS